MKNFFHSLSFKIAIKFAAILSLIVLNVVVVFTMVADSNVSRRNESELRKATKLLAEVFYRNEPKGEILNYKQQPIPSYIHFIIFDSETKEIIATNSSLVPILPITDEPREYFLTSQNLNILYHSINIKTKDNQMFTIQVSMDIAQNSRQRLLWAIPLTIAQFVVPIFIITFFIALFIAQSTLKPVIDITAAAQKLSTTNLDVLLPQSNNKDELDTLAQTFNQLFSKIKADFDRERQFTSNVSHELKTPVAVILGQANILRRWGKDDKEQLDKSISSIIKESHSMQSIITNLLQISRIESGKITPFIESININNMLTRLKDETLSWAKNTQIILQQDTDDIILNTDRELLHQILTVVCSNSVKFCGENPIITIAVQQNKGSTVITVTDNGPGFSDKDLNHVFERFYKGDDSHNRNKGGSGLGLSIAKVIMQTLNGTITIDNLKDSSNIITGAKVQLNFIEK